MILQCREFLKRLGYMIAGSIIVPYVPRTFYSFPSKKIFSVEKFIDYLIKANEENVRKILNYYSMPKIV
ncbi:hypothetical protein LCGC14_2405470 [marine sediment metagenome]|uniref:Uncharacterized protein n=1 Tax=marine sediment metagenome TaxID=412755 RepID=A0A0F9E6D4_9ZZZZ